MNNASHATTYETAKVSTKHTEGSEAPKQEQNEPKGEKKRKEPHVPTERSVKQNEKIGKKTLANGTGNT